MDVFSLDDFSYIVINVTSIESGYELGIQDGA